MGDRAIHRAFGNMTWPAPCEAMGDLAHRLTWGQGEVDKTDRLLAASIISAYMQMVSDPAKKRQRVIAELRKGPNLPIKPPTTGEAS